MARPRLPMKKAEVSGAIAKNAGRFSDRKVSKKTRSLGEPYATMDEYQCMAWHQMADEAPWLNSSHRQMLRVACRVVADIEKGEEIGISALKLLAQCLSKMGMTPSDETKVNHGEEEEQDDFDRMMN